MMSVYAWGANSHGQLSLGFESELCMSPEIVREYSFNPGSVRRIRGGGGHVLVLDSNGRVHACGWNGRGQLGLNSTEECFNTFQTIPGEYFGDVPVESIACGWDISGCITVTKKLYVWGSNSFQQLGLCQREFNAVRRPLPVILPRNDTPARISFGLRHCAILTEDNKVYVFGRLRIGDEPPSDLCITSTTLNCAPVIKIQTNELSELRITGVASGQNHILLKVLDLPHGNNAKRVIALGDNKFGQANSYQFEGDIKQIATGWTHNSVMLKDNRVLSWGRNCYGQLGIGSVTKNQPMPQELDLPSHIVLSSLHMGSEHGLLRSTDGEVYTWGWNEHGNCGNDATDNLCSPTRIQLPGHCKVAGTGAGFCYAICENSIEFEYETESNTSGNLNKTTSEDEDESNNMKDEHEEETPEDFPRTEGIIENPLVGQNKKERKPKISIAKELLKIKNEFPIWNAKEFAPTTKKLTDPIWHQPHAPSGKCEPIDAENDWNSKLESNCRRSSNIYVQEVNRAIYGDTTGHPPNGSAEYFQAAQNYAIYGKDFLDFPENLAPLLNAKDSTTPSENVPFVGSYGNGLYPTPSAPDTTTGIGFNNVSKQSSAASATYYQMCNGIQPTSVRPATGNAAYGMFLGNKVTYVAAAPAAPPLVYNQHSSTTTNFISNSLANAALASSPAILYSNPMLTTTTQQYLNTFFKETQYLSGATSQGTTVGTTTGIYERLVYAQMLQQQIYHQTQQQAAAVAAMFHKTRPTRATNGGGCGTAPIACAPNSATQTMPTPNMAGLNVCGRQAAMAVNASDLVKSPPAPTAIAANGNEDNAAPMTE